MSCLIELTLDSRDTLDTMATLHEGRDFRLRPTVYRLRDAFSFGEINMVRWAPTRSSEYRRRVDKAKLCHIFSPQQYLCYLNSTASYVQTRC
jgi:hypothetical protein